MSDLFNPLDLFPRVPLGQWVEFFIEELELLIGGVTRAIAAILRSAIGSTSEFLIELPPLLIMVVVALIAWKISSRGVGLFSLLGMVLIYNMGLWSATMETLTMILLATIISILIGLPLGILAARKEVANRIIQPVLDFMQTMPAFVYLIPVIFFFRLGVVPAVIATVIFSMPPVIRLTNLGIRQVPNEFIEASEAFGSTANQKLVKVQLPIAAPTIMAGINQCIMLALSMVVIAAMIGAGGLGGEVWRSIQRTAIDMGFESGLAVVFMAIILDRITQNVFRDKKPTTS